MNVGSVTPDPRLNPSILRKANPNCQVAVSFFSYIIITRHYPARQGGAKLGSVCHPRMSKYVVCYVPARQFVNHWNSTDFMLGYGRLSKCCVFEKNTKKVPPKWLQNGTPKVPTLSLNLTFWDVFFENLQNHDFKLPVGTSMCRGFISSSQKTIIIRTDARTDARTHGNTSLAPPSNVRSASRNNYMEHTRQITTHLISGTAGTGD